MAKQRFRVLAGSHREGKTRYSQGQVVTSNRDLAACFGSDKFQVVTSRRRSEQEDAPNPTAASTAAKKGAEEVTGDAEGPAFTLAHRGFGKYDIINEVTGEAANEKPLKKDQAETLVAELNAKAEAEASVSSTDEMNQEDEAEKDD